MKKFAVVTDSTAYLTEEQFKEFGIKRASLNIIAGDKTYRELEMVNADVYKLFEEGHKLTTSQPSPGEFLSIFEELIKQGYEFIFVIVIAQPLSGTYQSAKLAVNMMDDPSLIHVFENNMAAFGVEMHLLRLMDYFKEDLSKDEIIERVQKNIDHSKLVMTSLDLVSLIKSGRVSKAKGIIGSLLRVKPVVRMEEGKLNLFHVARTTKKAMLQQLDYLQQELKAGYNKLYVRVCNHNSPELANTMREEIQRLYKDAIITFGEYVGPVFNVHLGPKGFGISWYTE
jgi:DegV family protein with EDD domain